MTLDRTHKSFERRKEVPEFVEITGESRNRNIHEANVDSNMRANMPDLSAILLKSRFRSLFCLCSVFVVSEKQRSSVRFGKVENSIKTKELIDGP